MDLPVVNHEDYFAKIGDDHKFPINKFGELADYLLKKNQDKLNIKSKKITLLEDVIDGTLDIYQL